MKKKPDMTTKVAKYYVARKKGKTKKEAQIVAGYAVPTHATSIERTQEYQTIARYFKDELTDRISIGEIAEELKKNIVQDTDKGAKNNAIKLALERIEPDSNMGEDDEQVLVILKT